MPASSPKGKDAYDYLKRYFSHKNLIRTIRDRFAYHYGTDQLARLLRELNPESEQHFVTTQYGSNIFYNVAESIQNLALIATTGDELGFTQSTSWSEDVARQAIRKLYEEVCRVFDQFHQLCDDLLPLIIKQCKLTRKMLSSSAVLDAETFDSVILSMKNPLSGAIERNRRFVIEPGKGLFRRGAETSTRGRVRSPENRRK